MKLITKKFNRDYWHTDLDNFPAQNARKFVKRVLSKARRADGKEQIKIEMPS